MSFDEKTVTRIIQAVTTAVLLSLAEVQLAASVGMMCMLCMSLLICVAATIFRIKPSKGGSKEEKKEEEEEKRKRRKRRMASDDQLKEYMEKAKSVESVNFIEVQLKRRRASASRRRKSTPT